MDLDQQIQELKAQLEANIRRIFRQRLGMEAEEEEAVQVPAGEDAAPSSGGGRGQPGKLQEITFQETVEDKKKKAQGPAGENVSTDQGPEMTEEMLEIKQAIPEEAEKGQAPSAGRGPREEEEKVAILTVNNLAQCAGRGRGRGRLSVERQALATPSLELSKDTSGVMDWCQQVMQMCAEAADGHQVKNTEMEIARVDLSSVLINEEKENAAVTEQSEQLAKTENWKPKPPQRQEPATHEPEVKAEKREVPATTERQLQAPAKSDSRPVPIAKQPERQEARNSREAKRPLPAQQPVRPVARVNPQPTPNKSDYNPRQGPPRPPAQRGGRGGRPPARGSCNRRWELENVNRDPKLHSQVAVPNMIEDEWNDDGGEDDLRDRLQAYTKVHSKLRYF